MYLVRYIYGKKMFFKVTTKPNEFGTNKIISREICHMETIIKCLDYHFFDFSKSTFDYLFIAKKKLL